MAQGEGPDVQSAAIRISARVKDVACSFARHEPRNVEKNSSEEEAVVCVLSMYAACKRLPATLDLETHVGGSLI